RTRSLVRRLPTRMLRECAARLQAGTGGNSTVTETSPIRIGTRRSALAMAQTGMVADQVARASGREVELVQITTAGDTSRESLASRVGTGVFVSALRAALLADECDLVVDSLKDLPTAPVLGLRIGATPKRADARDVLVAHDGLTLATLPDGA